jgi:hypothetical protein
MQENTQNTPVHVPAVLRHHLAYFTKHKQMKGTSFEL